MQNYLHLSPHSWLGENPPKLIDLYERAFSTAREIRVVSAFLTEWPENIKLNSACTYFRLVVGVDFGTTRHAALTNAVRWVPKRFGGCVFAFLGAGINFHPKAVLWKEGNSGFLLIGSSNLTRAAFNSNVEANVVIPLTEKEYERAVVWIDEISLRSIPVNKAFLSDYKEAPVQRGGRASGGLERDDRSPSFDLNLALTGKRKIAKFQECLKLRRIQRLSFDAKAKKPIQALIRDAAEQTLWNEGKNLQLYENLRSYWAKNSNTRMGGSGWVIKGKHSVLQEMCKSLVSVFDAAAAQRDEVVGFEIERLQAAAIPTRRALLSELLCHFYPMKYPVLNAPVRKWISGVGFDKGARRSDG
ncbi:MAG: hypothetical protein EON54_04395, partial [Alcaligenaceae bacterium]